MRASPTDLFLVRQLEFGWSAWERRSDDSDYDARGGTVVAIEDRADRETGEVVRWFELLDFPAAQPRTVWLSEHDINAESIKLPNTVFMRGAAKRLNELLSRVRGSFTSDHVRWQELAFKLTTGVG